MNQQNTLNVLEKPTFLPRRMVDLAYSGDGDDCLFHADDCCLVIAMEKTRLISRYDTVDKNVYIMCFRI